MLRAAVIGVGAMGRHHARVYSEIDDARLVAVADISESATRKVSQAHGVPAYIDYKRMLATEKPDLVSIVVPTAYHYEVAMSALDMGINVLIEKPIAASVEQGREIAEFARKRDVKLTVGHIERFNPAITELRKRIEARELGRVFQIHARRLGPLPTRIKDVGVIIDLATHDLDVMRYLVESEVVRLYAEIDRRSLVEHEDLLLGLLRFEDGTIGVLDINWLTPTKTRELSITGERGMFVANYLTQDLYFYENNHSEAEWSSLSTFVGVGEGNMTRLRIEKREPLVAEIEAFVRVITENRAPVVTSEDALIALGLAEELIASGERNGVREPRVLQVV
ncbi:MAG: Gfo/Idh/MocA family oxidoreductase [Candidatus Marsarchaeota archaeon]|nr:Gfo/Idh/MocA family oxidoreductase [Candidatus Marsarchaeota archaeon]